MYVASVTGYRNVRWQADITATGDAPAVPATRSGMFMGIWARRAAGEMKAWPPLPGAAPQGGKGRPAGKPTMPRPQPVTGNRTNIVHQLTGDEADGVLLSLPDPGSVQRWATSDPATHEVLRIWYVAGTRARRLAAIATPEEEVDALANLLTERGVPVRFV